MWHAILFSLNFSPFAYHIMYTYPIPFLHQGLWKFLFYCLSMEFYVADAAIAFLFSSFIPLNCILFPNDDINVLWDTLASFHWEKRSYSLHLKAFHTNKRLFLSPAFWTLLCINIAQVGTALTFPSGCT